jgi:dihydroorotate dehydrogenase
MLYEKFVRPILFRFDPEEVHEAVTSAAAIAGKIPLAARLLSFGLGRKTPGLETKALGLQFDNPLGLAAGFDKDGRLAGILPALGFGFLEIGSVTLRPQPGNPKPRLFRLPEHGALINRLGFNSRGAEFVAARLKSLGPRRLPIGINLGLNKDTPKEKAPEEYGQTFSILCPYADYFVVNVSSPNTPGLRDLQERLSLEKILAAISERNSAKKPLLVKIAPDLSPEQLPDLFSLTERRASGLVISNTTLSRPNIPVDTAETRGGLSGEPLRPLSTELIRSAYKHTGGRLPIIGVGGVFSGGDAFEKIRAGASLVQLYTGLVYEGPSLVLRIQRELSALLKQAGFQSVGQAVGSGAMT